MLAAVFFFGFLPAAHASTLPYISDHQINFGTGNKYLQTTDIRIGGPGPDIALTRTYNSQSSDVSILGHGWTAPHTERIIIAAAEIILVQKGGRYVHFPEESAGIWVNETGSRRVIVADGSSFRLEEKDGQVKLFDASGKILSCQDANGNSRTYSYTGGLLTAIHNTFGAALSFTYDGEGRLATVSGPQGTYIYGYSGDNLTSVTAPDSTTITYVYDDPGDVHNLTGVINEEGERVLTVEYDANDRVIRSAKQGGAEEVTISYPATYLRRVTDSLGVETTYHLDVLHGIVKVGSFSGPGCSSCGSASDMEYVYDDRFRLIEKTDARGMVSTYTYDASGNRLSITEASGSQVEQTTTFSYTTENRLQTVETASLLLPDATTVTTQEYDANGNLISRTVSGYVDAALTRVSRRTEYSYNDHGQLTAIDGPRTDVSDVTTMSYYDNAPSQGLNRGQLHTVTNPLGHMTTYADYNVHGQAGTITDATGLITTRTFNSRGRLLTATSGGLTTRYAYDAAGDLQSITRPGGRTITYGYDDAGRISSITDNQGNAITYTYDSEGRKTGEEIRDPEGTLSRFLNFEYDDAGRLSKVLLPGDSERSFDYDEVGNLIRTVNATGLATEMYYDLLSRLELMVVEPGAESTDIASAYDSSDNLTQVTDARGNVTSYRYNDFNRRIGRTSPETGSTVYAYDEAGNLQEITDALGRSVFFTYDAISRPLRQSYEGTAVDFVYDQGANGTGRISSIHDEHGLRSFVYTDLGQLGEETRTMDSQSYITSYGYSPSTGDLESIGYPSGTTVAYSYDAEGQISAVTVDGTAIIDSVTRLPFGPIATATLAPDEAGISYSRAYDARYDIMDIIVGTDIAAIHYGRDSEGHVIAIDNIEAPVPHNLDESYSYAADSNRLAERGSVHYSYDAVGNLTADGTFSYLYDGLNRLVEVRDGGGTVATYGYDASNRRIIKTVGTQTTHYLYDTDSHLIAEMDADGSPVKEYIYLDGELLALKQYGTSAGIYYFINDHLGTPQKLIAADGATVWQAAYLPFGKARIRVEQVINNIRFPGQYYDAETGLHYNWHRYYDPTTGRYISADPIGLASGMNLYAYVGGDPVNAADPWGLWPYYERWGGPNRTAGKKGSWDTFSEAFRRHIIRQIDNGWDPNSPYAPKDEQDTCYMYHDICHGEARMHCGDDECCLTKRLNTCDRELRDCLIGIGLCGNLLDEARRIAAIPVFELIPANRNARKENRKDGGSRLLTWYF